VLSAHSGMLMRGGGRQPNRNAALSLCSRWLFGEVRLWLSNRFELFLDMVGQGLNHACGLRRARRRAAGRSSQAR
jgi:hypothetical protein